MTTWNEHRIRMRRYLRDPDKNVWNDTLLKHLWNDAQRNIQQRTPCLEDVIALRLPPVFNWTYFYNWEWGYFRNSYGRNYQALRYHQQTQRSICYRWEAGIDAGLQDATSDEGTHFTQPWEAFMSGVTPGDNVPIWFPVNFSTARLVAYDEEPLEYIDKKELQPADTNWISKSGKTSYYWRANEVDNCFILWPLPSSPSWDDIESPGRNDRQFVYTYSWETEETYVESIGAGTEFTTYHDDTYTEHVFNWENEHLDGGECRGKDDIAMRAQWGHEIGELEQSEFGISMFNDGDTVDGQVGALVMRDETMFPVSTFGGSTDVIDFEDNMVIIFKATPTDIEDDLDESDYPSYLTKYIEYDVLEQAYSVNNDGKIDSLKDYWTFRKELGHKVLTKFLGSRMQDRDFRLVTQWPSPRRGRRQPRLPSEYPPI